MVRDLGTVVLVLGAMPHGRHRGAVRGRVAAQLVCDQPRRHLGLALQQPPKEPGRSLVVPTGLHEDVEDVTVLVDGAPQILAPTRNGDEEFVEMPRVTQPVPATPQTASIAWARRSGPTSGSSRR